MPQVEDREGEVRAEAAGSTSGPLGRNLIAFGAFFVLWLLLTGSLDPEELIAGAVVSLAVVLVSAPRLPVLDGIRLSPAAVLSLLRYLCVFCVALLRANVDVARRVLSPALPIRPAVVEVRTGLKSSLGRLILANSITLTPGTLTVDLEDDILLVHWIDCPPGTDMEAATRVIAGDFERHLRGFLR